MSVWTTLGAHGTYKSPSILILHTSRVCVCVCVFVFVCVYVFLRVCLCVCVC